LERQKSPESGAVSYADNRMEQCLPDECSSKNSISFPFNPKDIASASQMHARMLVEESNEADNSGSA